MERLKRRKEIRTAELGEVSAHHYQAIYSIPSRIAHLPLQTHPQAALPLVHHPIRG
jgi:hypothetical protein